MARQSTKCEETNEAIRFGGESSNKDMNWNTPKRRQCQRYIYPFLVVGILMAAVSYHYTFNGGRQNEKESISTTSEPNSLSHEGRLRRHLFGFSSRRETRNELPLSFEPTVASFVSLAPSDSPTSDAETPRDGFPTESPKPQPFCIGTRITVDEFYDIFFDDFDASVVSLDLLEDAFRDSYNSNTNVIDCGPNILSVSLIPGNREQDTKQLSTKKIQFQVKSEQIKSPGLFPDSVVRGLFIASLNKYLDSRQVPIYALAVKQPSEPDFTEAPSFTPDFTEAPSFTPDFTEAPSFPPVDESEETPAPPTDPPTDKKKTDPPTEEPPDSSPADQPTRDKTKPPTENTPTESIIDINPTERPNTESATEKPSISEVAPDPTSRPTQTPSEDTNLSTEEPTFHPTALPTSGITSKPTVAPTPIGEPTLRPTATTDEPTFVPTESPANSRPTSSPTDELRNQPSKTVAPTEQPTKNPTEKPSEKPTEKPTPKPTEKPTDKPTPKPTPKPTEKPTLEPTLSETFEQTPSPNIAPSLSPNSEPILSPTKELLTETPTASAAESPIALSSESPTASPSLISAMNPESTSRQSPTASPNTLSRAPASPDPSLAPSILSAAQPTRFLSSPPSKLTTSSTDAPTFDPTKRPTVRPTNPPTKSPSFSPTVSPSMHPSSFPTLEPTVSSYPSVYPSDVPSSSPSALPSAQPTAPPDFVLREPELTSVRMVLTGVSLLSTRSQLVWVETTESAIRDEVITILNNQVELVNVRVSIISQNPQLSSPRKLQEEYQLLRNISATVASNLTIVFDVFFSIRAVIEEHNVRRYVGASLDTAEDQDIFILQLKSSGESAFQNLTSVRLILPPEPLTNSASQQEDDKESLSSGTTVGIAAVAIGGVAFIGVGYYVWTKRKPKQSQASTDLCEFESNNMMVDVMERPELDVSTLGDPIPQGMAAPTDASLAEETNISLPYDYKVAAHILPSVDESASYSFSEVSSNASSNAIDVQTDDDTLDAQYFIEETIQVDAPPGMLGLVLEADKDGIATVCDMKQISPVADRVHIGDKLVAVNDVDVSGMPVDEVTSLIASKQDKNGRTLVFSRRSKKLSAQDEDHL